MSDPARAPRQEPPSGKPLLFAAALAVLVVTAVLVALLLRDGDAPPRRAGEHAARGTRQEALGMGGATLPRPTAEPAPQAAPTAPAGAPSPAPLATLDLFAGSLPELLEMGRTVTARGAPLNSGRLKEIYEYGKAHPGDARPYLLMGVDSMNRGWYGFTVDHYLRAQKEDPRARQDARMLKDLVLIAGDEHYGKQGTDAIGTIYGASATSALEDAIAEAGTKGDTARVERLTAAVRSLTPPR